MLGEHVVAFRRQMLAVGLMRQSPERAIGDHDHRDAPRPQPALNFRCSIRRALASVVAARLQDDGTGPVRHNAVQALQHAFRGVAVDAGIDDTDVGSLCPQDRFELRGIGLIAGYPLPYVLLAPSATIVAAWANADTKVDMPIRSDKAPRVPSRKARNFIFAPVRIG
jgi:hypothetical protein